MVDCERCGRSISDPESPRKIGDTIFCDQCHDKVCGNCLNEIPDADDQYDIPPVGPGTTCPTCTARHVEWMCNQCGTEIPDETDQVRVEQSSKFDGVYCSDCATEARNRAKQDSDVQAEDSNTKNDEAPF
jgi:DNA-directed RNA polymerase subunit RPC12/RpoP